MGRRGKPDYTTEEEETETAAEPTPERAGILTRVAAALTTGFCEKCQKSAIEDAKGLHECARCRSTPLPHVAKRQKEKMAEHLADRTAGKKRRTEDRP